MKIGLSGAGRMFEPGRRLPGAARRSRPGFDVILGRFLIFLFFPLIALAGALRCLDSDLRGFPPAIVPAKEAGEEEPAVDRPSIGKDEAEKPAVSRAAVETDAAQSTSSPRDPTPPGRPAR